jgi:hypothetical protein
MTYDFDKEYRAQHWRQARADAPGSMVGNPPNPYLAREVGHLAAWRPDARFDLVMTHYAHPAMPQLQFYGCVAGRVAPGGTLPARPAATAAPPPHGWTRRPGRSSPPRRPTGPCPVLAMSRTPSTTSWYARSGASRQLVREHSHLATPRYSAPGLGR